MLEADVPRAVSANVYRLVGVCIFKTKDCFTDGAKEIRSHWLFSVCKFCTHREATEVVSLVGLYFKVATGLIHSSGGHFPALGRLQRC